MAKDIQIILTVNDEASARLTEMIEFLEENIVEAVAQTLDVPADFTQMNASYRGEVDR
jgi:hypothetical protein